MNARFGKYILVSLVIFTVGVLYGAVWQRDMSEGVKALGPATYGELAQIRAGMTKPVRVLASAPIRTTAGLVTRQ